MAVMTASSFVRGIKRRLFHSKVTFKQDKTSIKSHLLNCLAGLSKNFNNTQGSAIRRIGIERWQRNIAIAMGNADFSEEIVLALKAKLDTCSEMVAEHIEWALKQQANKQNEGSNIDIK